MSSPLQKKRRVAIFSPNRDAPTETFIRAHIERLPFDTIPIYGGDWHLSNNQGYLWPVFRYVGRALRKLRPKASRAIHTRFLSWKLKRFRVEVVLAEYGVTGAEISDACRKARIPLVVYFYGFDASCRPIVEQHLPDYQRMFVNAAAVVGVSSSINVRLEEWGAPPNKTHYIVCGVDPNKFRGANPARATAHFVAIGRFVEKKAPYLTVLAFRQVVTADPFAKLSMVGDGALLGPTRRLAAALGLAKNVHVLGIQTPEQVSELLRGARAFVQHSLVAADGDREGTPVGIIEAQMAGLPVVSTLHEGIPEVVEDGVTGLLVKEGDADAMGLMMTRLALDPMLADRLGGQARERALRLFTLEQHLTRLTKVLEDAALTGNVKP